MTLADYASIALKGVLTLSSIAGYFQVWRNYKDQSTAGLSTATIGWWYMSICAAVVYSYLSGAPTYYLFWMGVQAISQFMMVTQLILYTNDPKERLRGWYIQVAGIALSAAALYGAQYNHRLAVDIVGWLMVGMVTVGQLLQIMYIQRRHSTKGYSIAMLIFYFVGECIEFSAQLILGIPIFLKARTARGIILDGFQLLLFYWY